MNLEGEIVQLNQPAQQIEEVADTVLDKKEDNIDVECLMKVRIEN